ncbi:MAG TPA: decarboxylating 6-phosphogluconate dehydrogenase [Acidobacteriota bacterium]|nr:decarboxylating 6-phosphogluconate dehydrogenase [Acidobacteriota bacterium]
MKKAASKTQRLQEPQFRSQTEGLEMQLGMVGLGRMGANMIRRLMRGGHQCVAYDRSLEAVGQMKSEGARGAISLDEFVGMLKKPRVAWVMVPAGAPTEETVDSLAERFEPDDIIIDGGNSHYADDVRRASTLRKKGIRYLDVGTSGGIWGMERGYCLMIGGPPEVFRYLEPIFRTLAPGRGGIAPTPGRDNSNGVAEEGYLHCGPSGSGHFVKMVHNGIEYGIMQSFAEGFDLLRNAGSEELPEERRYTLPIADIAEVWRRGSVITSWLLDLTADALARDPDLKDYTGYVQDSGEGRWTIMAALESAVPAAVLSASLYARFRSREEHPFADKMLSAMRAGFGGHQEQPVRKALRKSG